MRLSVGTGRCRYRKPHPRGLSKLYRRTSEQKRAHEHLTTATTMYGQMDMRFYLEQAEAEMRTQT